MPSLNVTDKSCLPRYLDTHVCTILYTHAVSSTTSCPYTRSDLTRHFLCPYLCVDDMLAHTFLFFLDPLTFRFERGASARDGRLDESAATTDNELSWKIFRSRPERGNWKTTYAVRLYWRADGGG